MNGIEFFGILKINYFDFIKLPEIEQHKILVELKIYLPGRPSEYDSQYVCDYKVHSGNIVTYIGLPLSFNDVTYVINPLLLDEIFDAIMLAFNQQRDKFLKPLDEILEVKLKTFQDYDRARQFIESESDKVEKEVLQKIEQQHFRKVYQAETNRQEVLRQLLIYDVKTISDYLFGLDNRESSSISQDLYTVERCSIIREFIVRNNQYNQNPEPIVDQRLSTKQKVILIEALIAHHHTWTALSEHKKAKILSVLVDRNDTNIRQTLAMLNQKSSTYTVSFMNDIRVIQDLLKLLE